MTKSENKFISGSLWRRTYIQNKNLPRDSFNLLTAYRSTVPFLTQQTFPVRTHQRSICMFHSPASGSQRKSFWNNARSDPEKNQSGRESLWKQPLQPASITSLLPLRVCFNDHPVSTTSHNHISITSKPPRLFNPLHHLFPFISAFSLSQNPHHPNHWEQEKFHVLTRSSSAVRHVGSFLVFLSFNLDISLTPLRDPDADLKDVRRNRVAGLMGQELFDVVRACKIRLGSSGVSRRSAVQQWLCC